MWRCSIKPSLDDIPGLARAIAEAEAELGERGRLLIRYSGTQAMCRVMVEGPAPEMTDRLANETGRGHTGRDRRGLRLLDQ